MIEEVKKYKKAFEIPEDLTIEVKKIPKGHELIYIPEESKAILKLDKHSLPDIPELIAQLKMGTDYHPLLATYFFQENYTKEEEKQISNFILLITPLIDAWIWKTMAKYLPKEEFEEKLKQLKEMWEIYELHKMYLENKSEPEMLRRRASFSQYLIFKSLGINATLKLVGKGKALQEWIRYKKTLEKMVENDPNIEDIVKLPETTKAPFRVKAVNEPYPHFEVKY